MTASVSIVIPTWNGLALLERFLPSVLASANRYIEQTRAAVEVIVIDDGGTDGTAPYLVSKGFTVLDSHREAAAANPCQVIDPAPDLVLVRNPVNVGFSESCNRGFAAARYPLVFLLNNDVEVDIDAILPLAENFADPSLFAAHCRVFELESGKECGTGKVGGFSRGFLRVHQSYAPVAEPERGQAGEPLYSIFAGGGSAMFDRRKLDEIGGFDPLLSPFYWEDVELSYRAWKRGFIVVYEPRSVARHRVSSTIGKLNRRRVRVIEQRNRLIYHWVHLHDTRLLASHALRVFLLALTAPLRLSPLFIASCVAALKVMPAIRKRREQERRESRRTDSEVMEIFHSLARRPNIRVYDD